MVKIMTQATNEAYKESNQTMKQFVKSGDSDLSSFTKQYIKQRMEYHKRQTIKEILAQSWWDVWSFVVVMSIRKNCNH